MGFWGFLVIIVVQWAPKPYSHYEGPYITHRPPPPPPKGPAGPLPKPPFGAPGIQTKQLTPPRSRQHMILTKADGSNRLKLTACLPPKPPGGWLWKLPGGWLWKPPGGWLPKPPGGWLPKPPGGWLPKPPGPPGPAAAPKGFPASATHASCQDNQHRTRTREKAQSSASSLLRASDSTGICLQYSKSHPRPNLVHVCAGSHSVRVETNTRKRRESRIKEHSKLLIHAICNVTEYAASNIVWHLILCGMTCHTCTYDFP